tara:strand:+ start:113 stop:1501 length:1389 start_codon:yes stop_codon:yes gene_type:complete
MDSKTFKVLFFCILFIIVSIYIAKKTKSIEKFEGGEFSEKLDAAIVKTESDEKTQTNSLKNSIYDVNNQICEETSTYYNIDDSYVNTKENITTKSGNLYVKPKTKKGIYNSDLDACISPDKEYNRTLQCNTLMMSNCVDDYGLISNSHGENELIDDKEACKFKYCRAFCSDIKTCWKHDSNNDVIMKMKYNTNCTDAKFNESKPTDCFEEPGDVVCPDKTFYNYMSNDFTNRIYENIYDVSRQKLDNDTIQCIYKTDNTEKKFKSYDEALQYCSQPSTTTCHYFSNNVYNKELHQLEKASCSYNSNIGCISDLDNSYCDFTKTYFSMTGSEYVGTQKIDSFDKIEVPTELIDINSRQKKCDVSARYIYDNDLIESLSCEEQVSQCYNLENDVVQTMYGRTDPINDKCIYENCFSFEASSNANEQRRLENIEIERNNEIAQKIIAQADKMQTMITEANLDEEY